MNCKHVYQESISDICSKCGKLTHKINWAEISKLHKEWIASGKATFEGWWSI